MIEEDKSYVKEQKGGEHGALILETVTRTNSGKPDSPLQTLPFVTTLNVLVQDLNSSMIKKADDNIMEDNTMTLVIEQESKDICERPERASREVAIPWKEKKEPPSWVKHKIYNTRSKVLKKKSKCRREGWLKISCLK